MDILTYRQTAGISQAEFARRLSEAGHPCTQGLVSQWERGVINITAEWCVAFERVFPGMTRVSCRPDLFGPIVPASREAA